MSDQQQSEMVEKTNPFPEPIMDAPEDLAFIHNAGELVDDDIKAPEPWETRTNELADGQKAMLAAIERLSDAVASQSGRAPQVVERVLEREARQDPVQPSKRAWEDKLKPEGVAVLKEALGDLFTERFGEFKDKELAPTLRYMANTQERLLEQQLMNDYPDDTFGYKALRDDVHRFRESTGYTLDMETAYKQVAFANVMETLNGIRSEDLKAARDGKRNIPVDDGSHGTPPGSVDPDDTISPEEWRSAQFFFGTGQDGKPRSKQDVGRMWVEQRKGAKRDMMPD